MMARHKCYFDMQGRYHPCPGMDRMLDLLEPKLRIDTIINLETGQEYEIGPAIQPRKKEKLPGLLLNHCPFCLKEACNKQNSLAIPDDKIEYYPKQPLAAERAK